ncbi:FAD-dependent oxidoreductase [Desulfobulbus alkaliphilus]|uniref:FAD-dependent oxidoreductase n=1 Tax=Desulfobulbus alkaliphilus TaxID=869814 RepID=UPI00196608A2|nr:CoB--CoM heterodisulfide reductase iron-sulfur subunit A family protein [Desulfobulbus alkaliphilus]
MTASEPVGAVMVIGGGISGMRAALDLADSGYYVYLVEKTGAIGGAMPQYNKVFPTNDCSMCIIAPKLVECGRHANIRILTLGSVLDIAGRPGDFVVRVRQKPRYVDTEKCIACGQCSAHCPQSVDDPFSGHIAGRKAIYIKYPQAVPFKYQIDAEACLYLSQEGKCGVCAEICPPEAIRFDDRALEEEIRVGAVVMALGFQTFNPAVIKAWGYGVYPNVITSLQFERYLAPDGPTSGVLHRPSDGKPVRRIAFLQCIGSRDKHHCGNEYCSSVCCMYAIKEAVMVKEANPELEVTIFYTDIRTHGKEFDRYFERARSETGIRFVRSRIHGVEPRGTRGDLRLHYISVQGRQVEEIVDLVVLSVGLETADDMVSLADRIGIQMTPDRFAAISAFMPVHTSREGIFTCGAFNGPRDIPQSVIGGSAAAASVAVLLSGARHSLTRTASFPLEQDVRLREPRIGVFICHCGTNIAGVVDIEEVAAYAATLANVVSVERNLFTCAQDTQDIMGQQIRDRELNRIVVAACTPRTHEPLFRATLRSAGINEYLLEMANIRNQNAWVHGFDQQTATAKAKDLIRMAVAKVSGLRALHPLRIPITPSALVIGGGVAGMTAALNLALQGFDVHLVEKTGQLGGNALHLFQTWSGEHVPRYLDGLRSEVVNHPRIAVFYHSTVVEVAGHVGNFTTTLRGDSGRRKTVRHGVVLITTGAKRYIPEEFEYGKIPKVVASIEFDKLHMHNEARVARGTSFVFIQCVGSRNQERPYCSKSCCTHSIQSAIKLKKEAPSRRIYILYREIRTYGQRERLYNKARELGIVFINYELHGPPKLSRERDGVLVEVWDHVLHRPLQIQADVVILASATLASPDASDLANLFKLPLNADGFFQEAHAKLRPVEFHVDGVFVAGLAHYPKPLEESISQALAAAGKAGCLLARKEIALEAYVAQVDPGRCDGCGLCIEVCPYRAITLVEYEDEKGVVLKSVVIDQVLCKGCGICQGTCPKQGVDVAGFTCAQIEAQVDAALDDTVAEGT